MRATFEFELWQWNIMVVRDGMVYAEFANKIKQSYYAIVGILLVVSLILIFYFRRVIHSTGAFHHCLHPGQRRA